MSKSDQKTGLKTVADNRKARFHYEIVETYEAGIALTGTEVKSLRGGKATIGKPMRARRARSSSSSTPTFRNTCRRTVSITRPDDRGDLLHKRQINKLIGATQREGFTVIPLKIYFNDRGRAKVELGLGRGKLHDKRETEKGGPGTGNGRASCANGLTGTRHAHLFAPMEGWFLPFRQRPAPGLDGCLVEGPAGCRSGARARPGAGTEGVPAAPRSPRGSGRSFRRVPPIFGMRWARSMNSSDWRRSSSATIGGWVEMVEITDTRTPRRCIASTRERKSPSPEKSTMWSMNGAAPAHRSRARCPYCP